MIATLASDDNMNDGVTLMELYDSLKLTNPYHEHARVPRPPVGDVERRLRQLVRRIFHRIDL